MSTLAVVIVIGAAVGALAGAVLAVFIGLPVLWGLLGGAFIGAAYYAWQTWRVYG